MLANSGSRTAKISRDVSNFIITQVLERSDVLIKNSYRRLTTENVARNEHWSRIAEKVAEKFDVPAEMERVKSHFHNRKKVLLSRIKDELRNVPNSALWTTGEKLEELIRRRICIGEYDEKLARVCLDIEEEEKGRTDSYGNDQMMQPMLNMFTETSHQSLLSQLLSSSGPSPIGQKTAPATHSPMDSVSSKDSEPLIARPSDSVKTERAPLLTKLLTEPSTSRENGLFMRTDDARSIKGGPIGIKNPPSAFLDRKRRAGSPLEKNNRSSVFSTPNRHYPSHLIVDVTSPDELKRLLSVLIDNGFSRFQHVAGSDISSSLIRGGTHRSPRPRGIDLVKQEDQVEDSYESEESHYWPALGLENGRIPTSPGKFSEKSVLNKPINNRLECVDPNVKLEPFTEEDDELEEDVDEQTAELEAQLASDAINNGLALFGKEPSLKKWKSNENTTSIATGDIVTAICEMCGTEIRLNSGGSKWNFYEHVMMKHSVHKPYKCPHCPYQAGRKVRVRQHGLSLHHVEAEPIDMITPQIKSEWLDTMSKCFPDHQYGRSIRF